MRGRAEHGEVALGRPGISVRGRILAVIGFRLDDTAADAADEDRHANQLARDELRRRLEIDTGKNG